MNTPDQIVTITTCDGVQHYAEGGASIIRRNLSAGAEVLCNDAERGEYVLVLLGANGYVTYPESDDS